MNGVLLGVTAYVLAQLVIGLAVSRRIHTEADYLLAGRRLGYALASFSIFATWFGAETCIGAAGAVYTQGLAGGRADPLGYTVCLVLMATLFATPLWRRQFTTLADLFRLRYSVNVERLAVTLMVPTSLLWAAAQIRAFGQVLSASSTLEVELGITIAAGVVILYTVSGGLLADAITDVIQGGTLALGLVLVLFSASEAAGGLGSALANVPLTRLDPLGDEGFWASLDGWLVPICGSVVAQELVARVLAARSPEVARRATWTGAALYLTVGSIPVLIGLIGPQLLPGLADPERLLPDVAQRTLSPFLYVIFAGALVSAILSTVDSTLLASASLVSHNLVPSFRPTLTDPEKLRLARALVVVFGVSAYVVALHAEGVYALVESASSFGSAGLFVVLAFGLSTRLGGPPSAVAALLLGTLVWLAGSYLVPIPTPYLTALLVACVAYLALAAWTGRRMLAQPTTGAVG